MQRIDLEHLLETGRGEVGLQELLLLDLRELHQDVDALALAGDDVELLLEHADELLPARLLCVDALEPAHRCERCGVDVEHLSVRLGGALGVAEVVLVERGDAKLVGGDGFAVLQRLDLAAEHVA